MILIDLLLIFLLLITIEWVTDPEFQYKKLCCVFRDKFILARPRHTIFCVKNIYVCVCVCLCLYVCV